EVKRGFGYGIRVSESHASSKLRSSRSSFGVTLRESAAFRVRVSVSFSLSRPSRRTEERSASRARREKARRFGFGYPRRAAPQRQPATMRRPVTGLRVAPFGAKPWPRAAVHPPTPVT